MLEPAPLSLKLPDMSLSSMEGSMVMGAGAAMVMCS